MTPFGLSAQLVDAVAALRPVQATFAGVPGHDHAWEDLSPDGHAQVAAELRGWRDRFAALPDSPDAWDRLAVDVARDWLDQELLALDHREPELDLNCLASSFQLLPMALDSAPLGEDVAARLEALPGALGGYRRTLESGLQRGNVVAARQVLAAVDQAVRLSGGDSSLRAFAARATDPALARRLDAAAPGACAAYGQLGVWLADRYLPGAAERDGVGRERYTRALRRFMGADIDTDEAYAWGWGEVRRLEAELARLAAGMMPGRPVAEVTRAMVEDPAWCAPDKASFLARMTERQDRALALVDGHIDVPACARRIDVKEAPATGHLGAYYVQPSEDFSRAGAVWYLLPAQGPYELWREVATAYHEGFPGHHLQLSVQVSLSDRLSRFHRLFYGYSGYAEGWALYVERLMLELGGYEEPRWELGLVANELIRACRVVLDIGLHLDLPIPADAPFHPGARWTFELGCALLREVGGLGPERADREMTRYCGFPGQAPCYKLGERAILDLRRAFVGTPREFHARVLGTGNLGLDRLKERVLASARRE